LRLVDGVEVIQEIQTIPTNSASSKGHAGLNATTGLGAINNLSTVKTTSPPLGITMTDYNPTSGHADVISDVTMVQGTQSYIVSGSKDGVVKVWK
jgi:hypothetical protein